MELVEVEITGMAITARYGTLKTGDVLRTDAVFAKHLVDYCNAAKYPEKQAAEAGLDMSIASKKRKEKTSIGAISGVVGTDLTPLLGGVSPEEQIALAGEVASPLPT